MNHRRLNLLTRTTLLSWLVAIVTLAIYTFALLPGQKQDYEDGLRSKAHGVAVSLHDLAAGAVVTEDFSAVVDHCTEILRGDPALDYIIFTRRDGFSIIHERNGWRTEQLGAAWRPGARVARSEIGNRNPIDRRVFNLSEPFDYSGIEWGWLHIGLSLDHYDASLRRIYGRSAILGALAGLLALVASYFYARTLLRPILQLQGVVRGVARGELTARADAGRADELGQLAASINTMTEAILVRDRTLQEAKLRLEDRVEERTRELRLQIAARELAHDQLVDTQRQLLEASRLAGMAQVATGVLHNVGNVLNSVNISANLLRNELTTNPHVTLLKQTADLMRAQGDGLGPFLATDPRGRLVPPLIMEVADELAASCQGMKREFEQLSQNIDHIKQIVAVQQSYAKAGGVHQTFDPVELFSDALRIAQASISRHGVTLATDYPADRPPVITDRHLALQILVNLVHNAVQAVKPLPAGTRRICLRLTGGDGRVRFTVEDNGIGIEPADRHKLFQHGFTTRKDGHGFGLHSGALAARNLGGSLEVDSPGRDQGSRFTLDLPLTPVVPS